MLDVLTQKKQKLEAVSEVSTCTYLIIILAAITWNVGVGEEGGRRGGGYQFTYLEGEVSVKEVQLDIFRFNKIYGLRAVDHS